jgi:hypothetical protein
MVLNRAQRTRAPQVFHREGSLQSQWLETLDEVKLEDVSLGSRPILDGSLKGFQEVFLHRNLVRRHGVKIGQQTSG